MSSKRRGKLFVISSSSGTGKTTLAKELLKKNKNLIQSVSYTTRAPRPGERNGVDYFFVTKEEFFKIKKGNGFIEWANVFENLYGTPKKEVEKKLRLGKDVLLLIDVQGAKQIKKTMADAIFIFLAPPSLGELLRRLTKRGTESSEEIAKRFHIASRELEELNDPMLCDYRIVNKKINTAREVLKAIIRAEHLK